MDRKVKPYVPLKERLNDPGDIEMSLRDTTVDDLHGNRIYESDLIRFTRDAENFGGVDEGITNRVYEVRWFKASWMKYHEPTKTYTTLHPWSEYIERV